MYSASNSPESNSPEAPSVRHTGPAAKVNPWVVAVIALAVVLLIGAGFAGYAVASGAFVRAEATSVSAPANDEDEAPAAPVAETPTTAAPVASAVPPPAQAPSYSGTWVGQISGDRHAYSLTVTISDVDGVMTATATYPELPCTGTWSQTSRTSDRIVVVERMGSENDCFYNVSITLEALGPDTLAYSAQSGNYFITSTLVRS